MDSFIEKFVAEIKRCGDFDELRSSLLTSFDSCGVWDDLQVTIKNQILTDPEFSLSLSNKVDKSIGTLATTKIVETKGIVEFAPEPIVVSEDPIPEYLFIENLVVGIVPKETNKEGIEEVIQASIEPKDKQLVLVVLQITNIDPVHRKVKAKHLFNRSGTGNASSLNESNGLDTVNSTSASVSASVSDAETTLPFESVFRLIGHKTLAPGESIFAINRPQSLPSPAPVLAPTVVAISRDLSQKISPGDEEIMTNHKHAPFAQSSVCGDFLKATVSQINADSALARIQPANNDHSSAAPHSQLLELTLTLLVYLLLAPVAIASQLYIYRYAEAPANTFRLDSVASYDLATNAIQVSKSVNEQASNYELKNQASPLSDLYTLIVTNDDGLSQRVSVPKHRIQHPLVSEQLGLLFNENGKLINVDYAAEPQSSSEPLVGQIQPKFETTVVLNSPRSGKIPRRFKPVAIDTSTGKIVVDEKKGFIAQYWYIIVPVLLLLFFSSSDEPKQ
ncbi:hypothetical protein AYI68_g7837 [Smittium mucronatum]|uniref:Uncharacterized protein n=1 Tax=Smittium mucronatum TaxID=133383 RepID=A0A1R0GML2_9FUNG|nr:hypothetical protein AYI68_g7837 [Smittium mucronatum]